MCKRVVKLLLIPFLLFYAFPVSAVEKEERTWQDEMIYFLMVDRFHNGDPSNDFEVNTKDPKAYHGGDIKGVMDKLDYIDEMGFTAIWLTPIFDNEEGGYHGYWINDFKKVDEHFGTMEDFQKLVDEAHKRDIKVILDFVVNHTGYQHPWLNDPEKKEWFHEQKDISNWENQQEIENGWLFGLPDLNQDNPETREYLLDAAKWWIEETDIDGYRLDTVRHVPKDFWGEFSKEVKSVKEDFFLIGEVWDNDPRYVASYGEAGIDSFVDYPFYEEASEIFSEPDRELGPLHDVWKRNLAYYENPYLLGTFIDNHDNVRFTRKAVQKNQHPGPRIKMALSYMYTTPGIPIVYYGTEIALDGGEDPDNRRLMNFQTDDELVKHIGKLAEVRKTLPALARGDYELLYDEKGMSVYKRTYKEESVLVALNNTTESRSVSIPSEDIAENKELRGLLLGDVSKEIDEGYEIILDRESTEVYEIKEKSGLNYGFISIFIVVPALFCLFLYFANKKGKQAKND